jgi:transcription antitermination factor NusG
LNSTFPRHPWYALQVRPRFEKVVGTILKDKGYEEYVPCYKSRRRWSDRSKTIELPLFPGYTFCRVDVLDKLPVLVVPGVMSIVGIAKILTPITDEEIDAIKKVVGSGTPYTPWPSVQAGQRVCVVRGPLTGLEGTVIEVRSNVRLILSLPLLQRSISVEIDEDCVQLMKGGLQSCNTTSVSNSARTASSPL